jgi:soluble lytic murein transglycosylase-like protein
MSSEVLVLILLIITFLNRSSLLPKNNNIQISQPEKKTEVIQKSSFERIKNFILKKNKNLQEEEAKILASLIIKYSEETKIDPKLLTSLICKESRFNSKLISSTGTIGLGQLTPGTAKYLGVRDPFDPEENIRGTAYYLRKMLDMYEGRENQLEFALLSYKLGPNAVKKSKLSDLLKNPSNYRYIETIKDYYQEI